MSLPTRRVFVGPTPWLMAGAVLLLVSGCAAWRLSQSVELARRSEPLQQTPDYAAVRMLIVGDSTAVGTGATSGKSSLAGLIAQHYPGLLIENRARDGAKFSDVVSQLGGDEHFDIVLINAGGNDVIRFGSLASSQADIQRAADLASSRADVVIFMPAGNVGNAPFFFVPLSWLMTMRSRELHRYVQGAVAKSAARYVNLFHERPDDPFVKDPGLNASDGLHPSDAGYRVWFSELMAQADLAKQLKPALKI